MNGTTAAQQNSNETDPALRASRIISTSPTDQVRLVKARTHDGDLG